MMLGTRSWYAVLNGVLYAFQDKRQRDVAVDRLGAYPMTSREAYAWSGLPHKSLAYDVCYWQFDRWLADKEVVA